MQTSGIGSTPPAPATVYPTAERAARALALRLGHKMSPGGILRDASGGMVCRGWRLYASAATAAGDILATAGGHELRPQATTAAPAPRTVEAAVGRIITRGTTETRAAAGHLAQNILATLGDVGAPPVAPPPVPVAPPAQPPAAPPAVAVRVPTLPAVRPLRLEATTADEGAEDEGEDSPTLPGVPDLPGAVASPGRDEEQPDRGDRAPLPSGPGGREDGPAESPDGSGDREDEGESGDIEITYYPEIGERSRTLVDGAHGPGVVLEAILFCGVAPVLAALGGASSPAATCPTPTATTCPSSSSSSRCASRRPLGERQRYAVCASRCAAARRRRARLAVVASSAAPSVPTTTSHRPPARARGVARDIDAADGRPSALAAAWRTAFPQSAATA